MLAENSDGNGSLPRPRNLILEKVFTRPSTLYGRGRADIRPGPEWTTPLRAEYIGTDQLPLLVFRLRLCGRPYIPIGQALAASFAYCAIALVIYKSLAEYISFAVLCGRIADGFVEGIRMTANMAWPARIALALLLFTAPARAQDLPAQAVLLDKPTPKGNFLTRPFYDKQVMVLAEINVGAAIWDDLATRISIDRGGYERNPLMRPFVHNSGTLAAETIAEVWLAAFVADRMKHSSHAILRKTWRLPQSLNISAKLYGGINNTAILSR
jgi:hypothetical protein